ncbi:MAG TPA: hypothetical protein VLV87_06605 [Gammaproteobacteria bacterium]|nr:hypothetical protein [Gammaproteobacteria bacterium]
MDTRKRVLVVAGLMSLLAGCESVPATNAQQLDQLKADNAARVIAPKATFFAGLDIGSHLDMGIRSVDGTSVRSAMSGDKDDLTLPAGKHEIDADCRYVSSSVVVGSGLTTTPIDAVLESGHIYQLKAVAGDLQTCKAGIEDITDQVAKGSKQ